MRCRGTSSRHSGQSVSNQNFTGDGEELRKFTETVAEAKSYSYAHFYQSLASIVKNYHGIIEQLHLITQKQAEVQNEPYVEQKEESSAVSRQSGSDE